MIQPVPTDQLIDSTQPAPTIDLVNLSDRSDDNDGPTCMQEILNALGVTARAFAYKHGFNAGTIYNLANGTRASSYDLLWNICEAEPRISAEYLLRGEGQPLRDPDAIPIVTIQQMEQLRAEMIQALDRHLQ